MADRTAPRYPTRGESEKAARRGMFTDAESAALFEDAAKAAANTTERIRAFGATSPGAAADAAQAAADTLHVAATMLHSRPLR